MFPPIPLFHVKASFSNILCTIPNLMQGSVLESGFYLKPTFSCLWQPSAKRGQALCTYSLWLFIFIVNHNIFKYILYDAAQTPLPTAPQPLTHSKLQGPVFTILSALVMEKTMAHHPSTLAWKIPWTEEPGRLQSMGSLRVGHD